MFNDVVIVCIFLRNRVSRFRQKIIHWRAGAIFLVHARKRMSMNVLSCTCQNIFSQKTTQPVNFSQIFSQIFSQFLTFSVEFPVSLQRKNTRASPFYQPLHICGILRSHECGIIFTRFHAFYIHMNVELYLHAFVLLYGGENQVC